MLAVAAAAVVLTGLFYYRAFGTLKRYQWQLLLVLRIVAILIVVLLLFRPVLSYEETTTERPAIVFLIDTSASMSITDDASGVPRFQLARAKVEQWWDKLKTDFRLKVLEFSDRAVPLERVEQLAALTPNGKSTSLFKAITSGAKAETGIQAIIMLSDGIHNSAQNPLDAVKKLHGTVVHTVGVGASLRTNLTFRDVQVTGIECPDRMMINNKAKIVGSIEGIGLGGRVVTVILEEDGKKIKDAELTLDDIEGSQKVEFEYRPTVKGRHTYTVRVPPLPEEKIVENNHRNAVGMVVEPGIRVLYIEGTTRREYGAISSWFLAKDPDLEFCSMYQTRQNTFISRSNIHDMDLKGIPSNEETIGKFDVFIIGDLDSSFIRSEQQKLIAQRVRGGGGLVMIGGKFSLGPGGYAGTTLGEILPMQLGGKDIGQVNDPFVPQLTPEGAQHPIFANIAGFFPRKNMPAREGGLPELEGCTKVEGAKPGASVLAVDPGAGDMPVLAVQPVDKGRTAVFCGDTTWKWQQGPRALDQDSPFLRFWGQMIRFLAGRSNPVEAKASITASTDKGFYEPEEPIRVEAIVRDDKGEGTDTAKVVAKIKDPNNHVDEAPMAVVPGPGGHYGGSYTPKMAGRFEVVVEAKVGQLTLSSEKLVIEAGRANLEFEKLDMDEKMLGRIAAEANGRYVHISASDSLIDQLDRSQRQRKERKEQPLFWPPGFWFLFVSAVSVEWFLRKRFQLR
ncbi:MAG: glutamine amidotransferase [Thermoguttaceae bacterium]